MRKIGHVNSSALWNSLNAINHAQVRRHLLNRVRTSPGVVASQIELCEVLLVEISGIRSRLANDLRQTREPPQASF